MTSKLILACLLAGSFALTAVAPSASAVRLGALLGRGIKKKPKFVSLPTAPKIDIKKLPKAEQPFQKKRLGWLKKEHKAKVDRLWKLDGALGKCKANADCKRTAWGKYEASMAQWAAKNPAPKPELATKASKSGKKKK